MTKKAENLDVPFDMSDEAIERRWRDVAQLHRLGVKIQSVKLLGQKAEDDDRRRRARGDSPGPDPGS